MKITRQIVADKITDYLHGKVSQAELVDWAEHAMMDADFDETDADLLTDILGRLGLADVAEFGLRWQAFGREPNSTEGGAERERMRLGNPGNRDSGVLISDSEEPSQREAVQDGRSGDAVGDRAGAHQFLRRLGYTAKVIVSAD